jgi:hypothetical protein
MKKFLGTTIIEDCSTVMNTSKYHPILNNCVFIGDLKIHWELIPNQVLFYRDLKLNHQMLHIQPNAVKEAGTNAKEVSCVNYSEATAMKKKASFCV